MEHPVEARLGSSDPAGPSLVPMHPGGPWTASPGRSSSCASGLSNGSQAGEASLVVKQEVWIHQSCHITLRDATQHGMTDATQR